jgi:hypothetical protein
VFGRVEGGRASVAVSLFGCLVLGGWLVVGWLGGWSFGVLVERFWMEMEMVRGCAPFLPHGTRQI